MIGKIEASDYFDLSAYGDSYDEMIDLIEQNKIDLVIEIPAHFGRDLIRVDEAPVLISANAVNGTKGNLGAAYLGLQLLEREKQVCLANPGVQPNFEDHGHV